MTLEQQVTSLELSQTLRELGVPQESYFYWRKKYHTSESLDNGISLGKVGHISDEYEIQAYPKPRYTTSDVKWNENDLRHLDETEYAAFTVAELGEMLPRRICDKEQLLSGTKGKCYLLVQEFLSDDYSDENKIDGFSLRYGDTKVKVTSEVKLNSAGIYYTGTEADARAKMLIYLIQKKLITL